MHTLMVLESFVDGFGQLLVGLVTAYRYDGHDVDAKLAQSEAKILIETIVEKKENYEEAIRILTTRSKRQITATIRYCKEFHGVSISKVLERKWFLSLHCPKPKI